MSYSASISRLSLSVVCMLFVLSVLPNAQAQSAPTVSPASDGSAAVAPQTPNPTGLEAQPPSAQPAPAVLAPSTAPTAAHAAKREKEPPSGIGGLILGYGGIGLGALNLALIPVCSADFYPSDAEDLCVAFSIAYGVIGIGAGIPLAIMGHVRRARYLKWRDEHAQTARFLPQIGVLPDPSAPGLTARFRF